MNNNIRLIWFFSIFYTIVIQSLFAQNNCYKLPKENASAVFSIKFIDSAIGWACGNNGRILSTEDGGKNWAMQRRQAKQSLNSIAFFNPQLGIAVGFDWRRWRGMILKTVNGGKNWMEIFSHHNLVLNACSYADSGAFWIAAEKGILLQSFDMGDSWRQLKIGDNNTCLESICFINRYNGWAAGAQSVGKDMAVIFKTNDGGKNWEKKKIPHLNWIQSIKFLNDSSGFAIGWFDDFGQMRTKSIILKTTNGGISWHSVTPTIPGRIYAVDFLNLSTGLAVGYDYTKQKSVMLKTVDEGAHWEMLDLSLQTPIYDVAFSIKNAGWLAEGEGVRRVAIPEVKIFRVSGKR